MALFELDQVKNINMSFPESIPYPTLIMVLVFFSSPSWALDVDQLNGTETLEKWGQTSQLMQGVSGKYLPQELLQLKNQADRHAFLLSGNTAEPYHSVLACRSYCKEVIDTLGQQND